VPSGDRDCHPGDPGTGAWISGAALARLDLSGRVAPAFPFFYLPPWRKVGSKPEVVLTRDRARSTLFFAHRLQGTCLGMAESVERSGTGEAAVSECGMIPVRRLPGPLLNVRKMWSGCFQSASMPCLVAGDALAVASERNPVVECWPDCEKCLPSFALELFAGRKADAHRVDLATVLQHFVMQMRAG
jgi:hypothetical protein